MFLKELIELNGKGEYFVDGRMLHKYLGMKKRFGDWVNQNIYNAKYKFVENRDFTSVHSQVSIEGTNITRGRKDYQLSLETAKHLCMVSKSDKGAETRNYFINCEEQLKELQINNIKATAMLLTHSDKLNFTKENLYPILKELGVLNKSQAQIHRLIKKALIGKWENVNQADGLDKDKFKEDYRKLAESLKENNSQYFIDENQYSWLDII